MDSTRASSVSLNGVCTAAASNHNTVSTNTIPHYLRPSAGSCHDICKYGSTPALGDRPTKPLHKRASKLPVTAPIRRKKEVANHEPSADAVKPSSDVKSFSPRPKDHSPRLNASSDAPRVVKRGGVTLPGKAKLQGRGTISVGSKMPPPVKRTRVVKPSSAPLRSKKVVVKPSSAPSDSSGGMRGKRRRNDEAESGSNTASSVSSPKKTRMPVGAPLSPNSARKTATVELLAPRKALKRVKIGKRGTQKNALETGNGVEDRIAQRNIEFKFESLMDAPSSSSHGKDDEESDKVVSDTTMYRRRRNDNKRMRKTRVVRSGCEQSQPVKLKFQMGNSTNADKEDNVPMRHKLRTRVDEMRTNSSVSDHNKSVRIGAPKTSRTKDRYCSSKDRCIRARYGTTRALVHEGTQEEDLKRNLEENAGAGAGAELLIQKKSNLNHHQVQRKKEAQYLFNYVIEETASKLAERRKGTVKNLVGAFEKLISLQAPQNNFRVSS